MRKRKIYILLLSCSALINQGCLFAQEPPAPREPAQESKRKQTEPALEVADLIDEARLQQAEFAADALLRIVASGKIQDKQLKIKLLEEAFHRASEAQHPVRIGYGGVAGTRSDALAESLNLGVAKLSLQSRAVKALLVIDKKRARELFGEISPKLSLPSVGCKEGFIYYDVSEFYDALNEIVTNSFDPKERSRDEHIQFVLPYISEMASPAQVAPMSKAILSLKPNQLQLPLLIATFTQALKNIANDDHSFRQWMGKDETAKPIEALAKLCDKENVPKGDLLQSFRLYLLSQLNGVRCSDGLKLNDNPAVAAKYAPPKNMEFVNSNLFPDNPITASDINPSKIEEAFDSYYHYDKAGSAMRLEKFRELRFADNGRGERITDAEKEKSEWQIKLTDFLNSFALRTPGKDEIEEDVFNEKCEFYFALLDVIPKADAETRLRVFSDYIAFVSNSQIYKDNRSEWLFQAEKLLDVVLSAKGKERAMLTGMINNAGNSALRLYLNLKTLNPPPTQPAAKN